MPFALRTNKTFGKLFDRNSRNCSHPPGMGSRLRRPLHNSVIPAKAGIQGVGPQL